MQMEERLLRPPRLRPERREPVRVLDRHRPVVVDPLDVEGGERRGRHDMRPGPRGPDMHQMRLARTRRPDERDPPVRPVRPAIDLGEGQPVRGGDEEVGAAERRTRRQIERELARRPHPYSLTSIGLPCASRIGFSSGTPA
jgi:hypothetical protein